MGNNYDSFAQALLGWFELHGRHDLPWQVDRTVYRVWVSEIMLQQTQVATVIPYYHRFLSSFPSIKVLANAHIDQVLRHWQGLGYYARARNLHCSAQIIRDQYRGEFPQTINAVLQLPGIGRSTAAAILTFACGQNWPILDGNVKRVLARCFMVAGWYGQSSTMKQLWLLSEAVTPAQRTDDFNQAMMDLGSMVCLKSKPLCQHCPLANNCASNQQQVQHQYPHRKPAKRKPHKSTLMLLHRYRNQVLLYRRPPTAIWGGLWSLPEVAGVDEVSAWQQDNLSLQSPCSSVYENLIKHQFSHFSLDISVAIVELVSFPKKVADCENQVFVDFNRLSELGLPTPVRNILNQLCDFNDSGKSR